MNITQESIDIQKVMDDKINNKQTRGNIAPKGEELRDTSANGRRLDFWDQPITDH